MDSVELDLTLACIVGILPRERIEPQPLRVQVRMELDLEHTARTGALQRSVDYAAVDTLVRFLAIEGRFRLIESLGDAILRVLLLPPGPGEERAQIARASVRVSKPAVMLSALPSVALSREARWALAGAEAPRTVVAQLPEVEIARWVLAPGEALASVGDPSEGALLGLGGMLGRSAIPGPGTRFAAPCACTLLVVVRR
jgi:dihydroneopterin aldolase